MIYKTTFLFLRNYYFLYYDCTFQIEIKYNIVISNDRCYAGIKVSKRQLVISVRNMFSQL